MLPGDLREVSLTGPDKSVESFICCHFYHCHHCHETCAHFAIRRNRIRSSALKNCHPAPKGVYLHILWFLRLILNVSPQLPATRRAAPQTPRDFLRCHLSDANNMVTLIVDACRSRVASWPLLERKVPMSESNANGPERKA